MMCIDTRLAHVIIEEINKGPNQVHDSKLKRRDNMSGARIDNLLRTCADLIAVVNNLKDKIMATHAEVAAQLNVVADQVNKVIAEVVAATAALQAAIVAAGNSTPEVDAAMSRLVAGVQAADDLNPDPAP